MKFKLLAILFFLSISTAITYGQGEKYAQLGQFLDSLAAKEKFMGTFLLAEEGKPVFQKAVGLADQTSKKPMEIDSKLRIGSISKMFTSVLVFQAIEAKKLTLDQKLADFYPQLKNSESISISQLLQHRSGIFSVTDRMDYDAIRTKTHSEEELLSMMLEGGSVFDPDSKAEYSNSNFILLTFILQKVYGKPYSTILQDQILSPLGMKNTYVFGSIDVNKGEVKSYLPTGGWFEDKETSATIPLGAGAITSSTADLNTFIYGLFEGKLISKSSLEGILEFRDGYGRGIFSFPYYNKKSYGHTGGIDGFRSFLAYFPVEKVTLAVLSNGLNYNQNEILLAALNTQFGKEWNTPDLNEIIVSEELMKQYSGTYTSSQIPLQLTVKDVSGKISIQLTGQPQAVLEATSPHTFELKAVGAVFIFDPENGQVTLKQGTATIVFKKI